MPLGVFNVCANNENGRSADVVFVSGSVGQGMVSVEGEVIMAAHHSGWKSECTTTPRCDDMMGVQGGSLCEEGVDGDL